MEEPINPFASPTADATTPEPVKKGKQRKVVPYASGHARALAAVALLSIGIAVDLAWAVACYSQGRLLDRVKRREFTSQVALRQEGEANDSRLLLVSRGTLGATVLTAIAFLAWVHRANRNLPALGNARLEFSPFGAVGWFFVPIANIVCPYQALKEIYLGSDPDGLDPSNATLRPRRGARLVGWWWCMFLVRNVYFNFFVPTPPAGSNIDALITANQWLIVSPMISIVAALLAIFMVRSIDRFQTARWEKLSSMPIADQSSDQAPELGEWLETQSPENPEGQSTS